MQIITIEDKEFNNLLDAWKGGKLVGRYWRQGKIQVVCATRHFLLVSSDENPHKIAIKPARTLSEAENMALRLLTREEERGNQVERSPEFVR